VLHAFGGLFRGRQMMNGLQHWVAFDGDHAEITDSDLWFG
jgi:hypothetical protein